MDAPATRSPVLRAIMLVVAILAIALPAYIATHAPRIPRTPRIVALPKRVVPQAELPPVEPVEFVDLAPDDARAFNAAVPFSTAPNPAARPFRFTGRDDDLARATDCLATAVLYEAGDDTVGERAVAQVVLNRLRHPAFPKTVCGVIFEGQDRSTGCQFSFSCDHALTRWTPTAASWQRAHDVAVAALSGAVFKPVGYATHYHTNWVVPYWQSSLDKVAAVHTHLFFRWTGWWGTPPAFNRSRQPGEPVIAQLARISDAHRLGSALDEAGEALSEAAALIGTPPSPVAGDPNSFLVTLPRGAAPETYPALAAQACGARAYCKYSGWADATKTPTALPLEQQQIADMTFSYLRDRAANYEKPLWNCQQMKRPNPAQCMKVQVFFTASPSQGMPLSGGALQGGATKGAAVQQGPLATPAAPTARTPVLDGVRRRAGPQPLATPTPAATTPLRTSPAAAPSATPRRPRSDAAALLPAASPAPQRSAP